MADPFKVDLVVERIVDFLGPRKCASVARVNRSWRATAYMPDRWKRHILQTWGNGVKPLVERLQIKQRSRRDSGGSTISTFQEYFKQRSLVSRKREFVAKKQVDLLQNWFKDIFLQVELKDRVKDKMIWCKAFPLSDTTIIKDLFLSDKGYKIGQLPLGPEKIEKTTACTTTVVDASNGQVLYGDEMRWEGFDDADEEEHLVDLYPGHSIFSDHGDGSLSACLHLEWKRVKRGSAHSFVAEEESFFKEPCTNEIVEELVDVRYALNGWIRYSIFDDHAENYMGDGQPKSVSEVWSTLIRLFIPRLAPKIARWSAAV